MFILTEDYELINLKFIERILIHQTGIKRYSIIFESTENPDKYEVLCTYDSKAKALKAMDSLIHCMISTNIVVSTAEIMGKFLSGKEGN